MPKVRPGDAIEVRFLDHCIRGDHPIECVVTGRLLSKDDTAWLIGHWACVECADTDEISCILASTILKVTKFTEV